jgi:hypothetical protein
MRQLICPDTSLIIVADLEEDLATVAGARRLKAKMEANIRAVIGRVWVGRQDEH